MTVEELQKRIEAAEARMRAYVEQANREIGQHQGYILALREILAETEKDDGRQKTS